MNNMNTKHLKPFPADKSAKELGIDTSKKFVVVRPWITSEINYKKGDVVKFINEYEDDKYGAIFENSKGEEIDVYILWKELAYAPNQKIKQVKSKPYKFILIWEEETDPAKLFHTRNEALNFAKTLPNNAHNIQLVEIKSLEKVEIVSEKKVKIVK